MGKCSVCACVFRTLKDSEDDGYPTSKLRSELGESLATVRKFDVPLAQATSLILGLKGQPVIPTPGSLTIRRLTMTIGWRGNAAPPANLFLALSKVPITFRSVFMGIVSPKDLLIPFPGTNLVMVAKMRRPGLRRCSKNLSVAIARTLHFVSGGEGHVTHSESHSNFLEKVERRSASRKDPGKVVRKGLYDSSNSENDRIGSELHRHRVKDNLDCPGAHTLSNTLCIAFFNAHEFLSPIRQSYSVARLLRKPGGRLDCTIAATDNQDALIPIVIRFDQTVHHFGEVLSVYPELPRIAGPSDSQDYGAREISLSCGHDREAAVGQFSDVGNHRVGTNIELNSIQNHVPEGEKVFFG